ncbi:MAG: hypothetical protein HXS40_01160 [Theionarchaea archaeon]|nr:hypothetical protein [Theionarchaea archaeon]
MMNMENPDYSRMKLYLFQVVTAICTLVLFVVCESLFDLRFRDLLLPHFTVQIFIPNLSSRFFGPLPQDEVKHLVIAYGVLVWTYMSYIVAGVLLHVYQGGPGFYTYFIIFIPPMILIAYLAHSGEWRRFCRSLTRSHFDEYVRKEAEERAAQIEVELKKRGIRLPSGENPGENSHNEDCQTTED